MTENTLTTIEINGVKFEVDLRNAKKVEQLRVGTPVKCLVKKYSDYAVYPGVVIGFNAFEKLPTIVIAYIEVDYGSADLKFHAYNSQSTEFEVVADVDFTSLEIGKDRIIELMDKDITKKQLELDEVRQRKEFFLKNFGSYFAPLLKNEI